MRFQRVLVIVLDGVGVGALPDAAQYGDQNAATLPHVAAVVGGLTLPLLQGLGLGSIVPLVGVPPVAVPAACWGKMASQSAGKDSVSGHWEIAGVITREPFSTFPEGFPDEVLSVFTAEAGVSPLGNAVASGTEILRQLGEEHLQTGRPILYTSSDSVLQIAAHEERIPPARLYDLCRRLRSALEPWNICRVIARPFRGSSSDSFFRTSGRHDFTCYPPEETLLDRMQNSGLETIGVGKISDLFAHRGLSRSYETEDNADGMRRTQSALAEIKRGLVMTNLVDFDMLYGHRLDAHGFARALETFDTWLSSLLSQLKSDDLLIITADHGCDPTTAGTDHSREYVPLLCYSKSCVPRSLGTRQSFADLGATVAANFGLARTAGCSFLSDV